MLENIEAWQVGAGIVGVFVIYWVLIRKKKDSTGGGGKPPSKPKPKRK